MFLQLHESFLAHQVKNYQEFVLNLNHFEMRLLNLRINFSIYCGLFVLILVVFVLILLHYVSAKFHLFHKIVSIHCHLSSLILIFLSIQKKYIDIFSRQNSCYKIFGFKNSGTKGKFSFCIVLVLALIY